MDISSESEFLEFSEAWASSWECVGRNIAPRAVTVAFEDLSEYRLVDVLAAIRLHRKNSNNPPMVSDIRKLIDSASGTGHVGSDEAWAIAVRMFDENETVIVTDEITQAWGIAEPVYHAGDEVGARMAFKDAYNRFPKAQPPKWRVLPGIDQDLRHQRVSEAVNLGRLPASSLSTFPALEQANPSALVNGYLGYIPNASDKETAKKALGNLRAMLGEDKKSRTKAVSLAAGLVGDITAHQRTDGFASMHASSADEWA